MTQSIDRVLVTQFADMLHVEAQQMKARTRPFVSIKQMSGDLFAYDGIGSLDATEITSRNQKVEFSDLEFKRRKISRRRFSVTVPIDSSDIRGMLVDPQSNIAGACMAALERQFDRVVYDAMFATVLTGRDFETSVAFATDGGTTTDATAGLTYEKLLEVKENFNKNDVGLDGNELIVIGYTEQEETALMKEVELTSGDFSRQFAIDKGEITRALGMDLIKFASAAKKPVIAVSGGVRSNFAMSSRGICVGMSKEPTINIQPRTDLIETTQVQVIMELGAVRTEGVLVQKLTTTAV